MKLQLTKPICFFDIETTGTEISKDRIVEIAILKLKPEKAGFIESIFRSDSRLNIISQFGVIFIPKFVLKFR